MVASQLKKSIIQHAIEGKLTIDLITESDSFDYRKKIEKLKSTNFSKKQHVNKITLNEFPFEIPDNWSWFRIGEIAEINLGFTYKPTYREEGFKFLSVKNISQGFIDLDNVKYISEEEFAKAPYGAKPRKGDILFGRVGTLGKPQIITFEEEVAIFVSLGFLRLYSNYVLHKYICYWMESSLFLQQVAQNVRGTAQVNLNTGWLKNFLIPVPPLDIQEAIVYKLERILPLVEELDGFEKKLKQTNIMFGDKLRSSLLFEALKGKLTSQLFIGTNGNFDIKTSEETRGKKVVSKRKKTTNSDRVPFEIPSNWEWVSLNDIALSISSGGTPLRSNPDFWNKGTIPWLKISDIKSKYVTESSEFITELAIEKSSAKIFKKGTILYSIFATIGDVGILDFDAATNQAIAGIELSEHVDKEYVYYALLGLKGEAVKQSRGMAQVNINQKILRSLLIPLPPIEEQKRIVAKLEQLLPLVEELNKDLIQ